MLHFYAVLSQKLRALLLLQLRIRRHTESLCLCIALTKKHGGRRAAISEAAEDRGRRGQQQPPPSSSTTTSTTSRPRRNCEHSRKDHDDKLNSSRVCCCCCGQPPLAGSGASQLPPSSNYGLQKSVKWDASRGHQPPDGQSLAPALLPGNDDGFSGVTFWPLMQKQQPQKKRLLEIRFSRGYS